MNKNILEEIKSLDIIIMKKLYNMAKILGVEYRITTIQMTIIKYLMDNNKTKCHQKELCEFTERNKSTISSVISNMEKNGLIIKEYQDDLKLSTLSLTNKGKKIFTKMQKTIDKLSQEIIQDISVKDLNTFFEVINSLKKNINKKGD